MVFETVNLIVYKVEYNSDSCVTAGLVVSLVSLVVCSLVLSCTSLVISVCVQMCACA